MKLAMATTFTSGSHTKAWTAFEENLESIAHLLDLVSRENAVLQAESTRFQKSVDRVCTEVARLKAEVGKSPSPAVLPLQRVTAKLTRSAGQYKKARQTRDDRIGTATLWQAVMLVTCVEAYLQDLLAAVASADPEFMADNQRIVTCAEVVSATSLDDLASELRHRWARGWVNDGGPKVWILRLTNKGVKDYPDGLASRLELI